MASNDDRINGLELSVRQLVKYWNPNAILKAVAQEFERAKEDNVHRDERVQMALAAAHMREDSENF